MMITARKSGLWLGLAGWASVGLTIAGAIHAAEPQARVEFDRDVRPILSQNCFACHGPDESSRQAELRLDRQADVLDEREGAAVIVPGQPEQSELYRRISSTDDDERMPPADSLKSLSPGEIELIATWIRAGAPWQGHWSFQRPRQSLDAALRRKALSVRWPSICIFGSTGWTDSQFHGDFLSFTARVIYKGLPWYSVLREPNNPIGH